MNSLFFLSLSLSLITLFIFIIILISSAMNEWMNERVCLDGRRRRKNAQDNALGFFLPSTTTTTGVYVYALLASKDGGRKYQVKSLYINLISYFTCYIDQNLMRARERDEKSSLTPLLCYSCAFDNARGNKNVQKIQKNI